MNANSSDRSSQVVQPASPAVEVASEAMETAFYEEVSPALDESTMNEYQAWFNLGWRAALERSK